jgi:hypothetical protein
MVLGGGSCEAHNDHRRNGRVEPARDELPAGTDCLTGSWITGTFDANKHHLSYRPGAAPDTAREVAPATGLPTSAAFLNDLVIFSTVVYAGREPGSRAAGTATIEDGDERTRALRSSSS